ncbi:heavy-metal-associated domain-containing protein [Pseudomonas sp. NCCP-436]|uniref:heavy-metal-associated domain-containing protein n=1 Tax=Pseudomonas sp. NCCP-436 TaxID=2842481 RepID=UPI001C7EFA04|nr:cation transporter [Pseudomonas sp. NCCP-436]GIZ13619.1 copper chaperone CopZ [Pseudomonas sp. NCCP-436]
MQQFKVSGMSCGHCVAAVTRAIQMLDQSARVEVDLAEGLVRVESTVDGERILSAILQQGYEAVQL